jgi:hypothetical protein
LEESCSTTRVDAYNSESKDTASGDIDSLDATLLERVVSALIPNSKVNPTLVEQHLRLVVKHAIGCPV